ncbi:hypothetical protein [Paenibacillus eucommiae]|uniref:Uncharacterized protein n=1 Tax=Paenibacillus eucommiae TaxID=1355755 RepID=A0ABS4IVS9_9BACL|nr:hypothetical protein [Paenibacillus eucommiae]MBP1990644.1 hypothetical protein [Paenibacillus eucommiae]
MWGWEQIFKGGRYRSSSHSPSLSQLQSHENQSHEIQAQTNSQQKFSLIGGDFLAAKGAKDKEMKGACAFAMKNIAKAHALFHNLTLTMKNIVKIPFYHPQRPSVIF